MPRGPAMVIVVESMSGEEERAPVASAKPRLCPMRVWLYLARVAEGYGWVAPIWQRLTVQ